MATNTYYQHSTAAPAPISRGSSAIMRAEFDAIAAAFQKVADDLSGISASSEFRLIYQGALASDPILRYDGTALADGDLYFNTLAKTMKTYFQGVWYLPPSSTSTMPRSGGDFTGPITGTSASFSGNVTAGGFSGSGAGLTGFELAQITAALGYVPANKNGDTFTGAINGTSATFSGTVQGAVIRQTSDERKKMKWKRMPADFLEKVAAIKKRGIFFWKKGNTMDVGVGAQSLAEAFPEAVSIDDNGVLCINQAAALVIAIELAQEVVKLKKALGLK
jgi:hypothetical protein